MMYPMIIISDPVLMNDYGDDDKLHDTVYM